MRKWLALLALLASLGEASAQWQVPSGTIPIGRGPGVVGFNSVVSSATGTKCLLDTNPPSFGICGGGLTVGTTTITGGTSNGILFNNSGVLGNTASGTNGQLLLGVTGSPPQLASMSQDCVITNAGVITCTKTNNVSFAASATTDTTNATNISSGTLVGARYAAVNLAAGAVNGGVTGQLPLANGGCNGTTQQSCLNNVAPTPTRAGDIIYYNGTNWIALAGNNSGTQVLQENSSGVPSWATVTGTGTVTSVTCGTGLSGGTFTTSGTCAVSLSKFTNSLGADVLLNNTANYFDGPSVAQGTSGTWFASGTVTLVDTTASSAFDCKLWDGTTVIASARTSSPAALFRISMSLSGFLASPAANIRISCKDLSSTSGTIVFNATGNSKDSTLSVVQIQ